MKQIFDWLRGAILDKAFEGYNGQTLVDIHDVGNIINEAEAKWKKDCCEWEYDKVNNLCQSSCNGWLLEGADVWHFNFCPYCGKRKKISEVE